MSSNIYYDPKDFGLEVVAEIDYSSGDYAFDIRVIWKTISGDKFYTARDSGCSCPTPFKKINLGNVDKLDFSALRREIQEELAHNHKHIRPQRAQEFLEKVRIAIGRKRGVIV